MQTIINDVNNDTVYYKMNTITQYSKDNIS